ncbi:MAG: acyltransferase [Candidatus Cybelea sp.]|jgi:UDP-2-acetamido-3-amino-2,3-dideoxy-glucuronate N-acetyltransferase
MAIHPTAIVEPGVTIGRNTAIWDHVHVRHSTRIGADCIVGEKSYIAYGVEIHDLVKINAFVYICTGVTIERGVMIAAGVTFTNDRFPRAATPAFDRLLSSDPDDHTLNTVVREGATIGAQATIGPGLTIGRFAMIGMGSVVTRDVPDFTLVAGNPARAAGHVCICGQPLVSQAETPSREATLRCGSCATEYALEGSIVRELAARNCS